MSPSRSKRHRSLRLHNLAREFETPALMTHLAELQQTHYGASKLHAYAGPYEFCNCVSFMWLFSYLNLRA